MPRASVQTGAPAGDVDHELVRSSRRPAQSHPPEGAGVFFLVSIRPTGRHQGHGVVRAGSLHLAGAGLSYPDSVIDRDIDWQTLWSAAA